MPHPFGPAPVCECRLTDERRFVTDISRFVENHDESPADRPEMNRLKQPHLSLVVNYSLHSFDHGHMLLPAFYRKPADVASR
jgi:hypothetical protein